MTQQLDRAPLRVAILQSNYIPWKGYFDIIHDVDLFIFYDDVQYTLRDWRNRNKIKTSRGTEWLTAPTNGTQQHLIYEVEFTDPKWQSKHWQTLRHVYGKTPYFERYRPFLEDVYLGRKWKYLFELNQYLIEQISRQFLGISTVFTDSRQFHAVDPKQERIIDLVTKAGATLYVSGPSARDYIDETRFAQTGVELVWKDYGGYPEYPQFHPPFEHGVTILDLLFHTGPDAPHYIWGWRDIVNSVIDKS
ncbi:MAG: WbqC family protein [Nitrosospira sp.]|nr:WbqC family protein [Nitrosospira sp.]